MANLPESSSFDAGVYQIETSDPVLGGPSGVTNTPLKNLANRTRYLKDHVDSLESGATVPPGIATENWVNGELQKRDMKASVRCATTANISLSGLQTIDGVALSAGDRVLVRAQSAGQDNGIYEAASGAWTRAADANTGEKVTPGMLVYVESGTTQADIIYKLTTDAPVTLGSSVLTFANILDGYAPLASPALTGTPTVPTAATGTNTTQAASTAFVQAQIASSVPAASEAVAGKVELATAAETTTGTDSTRAVHPAGLKVELDKKAPIASPALTGTPTVPTAATGTNTTQAASTAFVQAQIASSVPAASETAAGKVELATAAETTTGTDNTRAVHPAGLKVELDKKAPLASPTFTGTPTAPTPATGLRSTAIATMQKFADEFSASLTANGYQKLPSGLIVQWGKVTIGAGGSAVVTFPVAFTSQCFSVVPAPMRGAATATLAVTTNTPSATAVTLYNTDGGGSWPVNWIAIGN